MDLSGWIERNGAFSPARTALVCGARRLAYADFAREIERTTAALAAAGVGRGDRVAHIGYNGIEPLQLLFACARLGALFTPLSWRLAPPEHRAMLADCGPRVVVAGEPFLRDVASIVDADAIHGIALGGACAGWTGFDAWLARASTHGVPREGGPKSPVLLCYTSGSTGQPKGVVLTQEALLTNAINSVHMHDLTSRDVVLTTLPLFHVGGLNIQTMPALHAGATVVLHPRFEPRAVVDALERDGITLTVLVPAQLELLGREPRWREADLSSLRAITTGSTIIDEAFVRKNLQRDVPLLQVYGATETCPIAAYQRIDDAAAHPGSIGKAALHCELRIVGERGRDVAPGASGEIVVRGANVMRGYWNKPRETGDAFAGGWYRTGDVAHADGDGWMYVDGRCRDVIISGGENIYPAEIESLLAGCAGIAEVAVVGRADERWGEALVAIVVPEAGANLTAEAVVRMLDGRVARYKYPRDVVFAESLPRTALGKLKREDLRRLVQRESVPGLA
jgi:fatty-acyl-CoA synthase